MPWRPARRPRSSRAGRARCAPTCRASSVRLSTCCWRRRGRCRASGTSAGAMPTCGRWGLCDARSSRRAHGWRGPAGSATRPTSPRPATPRSAHSLERATAPPPKSLRSGRVTGCRRATPTRRRSSAASLERAIGAVVEEMLFAPKPQTEERKVRGVGVSPGVYEGTARLIHSTAEFGRIERGDVLVTNSTTTAFNIVLPLLGAIVTDRGGLLSHAAIVAREYGIPAVVGCSDATAVVADGDRVRVDGRAGEVEVLA